VELEESSIEFKPQPDRRVRMPEPLPVKLVAVEDMRLLAPAGVEVQLDEFYVGLWGFERIENELTYRAENFRLSFDVREAPVQRESVRPTMIEVPSLAEAEKKLIDAKLEYIRQRAITPGRESLLVQDPAGNWVEVFGTSRVG
jgi:hypothetical protein